MSAKAWRFAALLGATYAVLLITLGFQLYEDASIPPWVLAQKCSTCYAKDVFLQSAPAERLWIQWLYLPWIDRWWGIVALHAAASFLLIAGLYRIAHHILEDETWAWLAVWIALVGLYHRNWGSNELYYPNTHPSLLAKAVGSWVWASLLERRWARATGALLGTVALHPSIGWQVWLFSLPLLGRPQKAHLPYGFASLATLAYAAWIARTSGPAPTIHPLWDAIFIEFRMHMHFDPTSFRLSSHLLFAALWIGGLYASWKAHSPLRWCFVLYGLAIGAYLVNFYGPRIPVGIYVQLPRATVWLKPLGVIWGLWVLRQRWQLPPLSTAAAIGLFLLVGWGAFRLARHPIGSKHLSLLRWYEQEPFQLGEWARQNLPDTVLIATVPSAEAEQALFFAQRSGYFWIGPVFRHPNPALYRQRAQQLYGIDPLQGAPAWKALFTEGPEHLRKVALKHPDSLRAWGITHLIGPSSWCLPLPRLWSGEKLSLWSVEKQ